MSFPHQSFVFSDRGFWYARVKRPVVCKWFTFITFPRMECANKGNHNADQNFDGSMFSLHAGAKQKCLQESKQARDNLHISCDEKIRVSSTQKQHGILIVAWDDFDKPYFVQNTKRIPSQFRVEKRETNTSWLTGAFTQCLASCFTAG